MADKKSYLNWIIFTFATVLLINLFGVGCNGPAGPDGDDSFLIDSLAPLIEWISPDQGLVTSDTVIISARATDDKEIWRMVFYIAGFEEVGVLVDSATGIYEHRWAVNTFPDGPYPLMARAWDASRNMATTPVVMVELKKNE